MKSKQKAENDLKALKPERDPQWKINAQADLLTLTNKDLAQVTKEIEEGVNEWESQQGQLVDGLGEILNVLGHAIKPDLFYLGKSTKTYLVSP